VAFSPDGARLYAAGTDKVVYVWTFDAAAGRFVLDPAATYRVPIGPGPHGILNALAVSPDGSLLATAGQGLVHVASDVRHAGFSVPEIGGLNDEGYREQGTIYVFDTRSRVATPLVGHLGPVFAMTFLPAAANKPPLLVSAAKEWDNAAGKYVGAVRVWDARHGTYVAGVEVPYELKRPALAAWHTGPGTSQVRVAVAWGDATNQLRIWDVEKNSLIAVPDGSLNNVAALGPQPDQLITGSVERLRLWQLPLAAGQAPAAPRELRLPPQSVPRAIALFASQTGGRLDRAAVVVRLGNGSEEDRLYFVDLDNFRLLGAASNLWNGRGAMPAIAAAAGHIAVAGGTRHELRVYAVNDLLGNRAAPQSLAAPGVAPRLASFVRKDRRLGVMFSAQPAFPRGGDPVPAEKENLVFDPKSGQISAATDWAPADADARPWKLIPRRVGNDAASAARTEIEVVSPDGRSTSIRLNPDYEPTAYAVLPPSQRLAIPLVAVAAHELGQPSLRLYNGQTGEPIRMLQEHVQKIISLGFSDDGRFLLSSGEDGMICAWSLLDLGDVLGKRGALRGVALKKDSGKIVVAEVGDAGLPQLSKGDVLKGIMEHGRLREIATPLEFYMALSRIKPGETVDLARTGPDGRTAPLPVRIGQGVDERKPLFTLFVAADGQAESWQWVGWSPLGWYDASRRAAEQLIGWHFNTGDAAQPARFSRAQEYQVLHYPGLLEQLLSEGKPPLKKLQPPLPRPIARLGLSEPGQPPRVDGESIVVVRSPAAELHLLLVGPAAEHLDAVLWQFGDGAAKPCKADGDNRWLVPLDDALAGRGDHPLRITMRTAEREPQTFRETAVIRYVPLPPTVAEIAPEAARSVVHEPELGFRARVSPPPQCRLPLVCTLIQTSGTREIARQTWEASGAMEIDKRLKLEQGENVVQLVAANAAGAAAPAAAETIVTTRTITYTVLRVPPPQIDLSLEQPGAEQHWTADTSETIVVQQPVLRIDGRVSSGEPLTELALSESEKETGKPLPEFQAGKNASIKVTRDIQLRPGLQRVSIAARSEHSDRATAAWNVFYRPPAPQAAWTSPADDSRIVEGRDARSVVLHGRFLAMPKDARRDRLAVAILRNGFPLPDQVAVDAEHDSFSATVALEPGENRLQWQVSNPWQGKSLSDFRRLNYLRPPRILDVKGPAEVKEPFADCTVRVQSPIDLPLRSVTVNGRDISLDDISPDKAGLEKPTAAATAWKLAVPRLALQQGLNTITFSARNDDGETLQPQKLEVKMSLPPPPKAKIVILSPETDVRADDDRLSISVSVQSASRITALLLRRDGVELLRADVARQFEDMPGRFELVTELKTPLRDGVNLLEAVAVNAGGESSASVRATYVPPPVRVVVDRVEGVENGKPIAAELAEGKQPLFRQPADEGIVLVHGRVRWSDDATRRLHPRPRLYLSVNGFLQPPVPLGGKSDLEQAWDATVRLNQAKDNWVTVQLPGVSQDAGNRTRFCIDCLHPDARQRLMLLVISIPEQDARALKTQALEAVQGKLVNDRDQFATPAFPHGTLFGPLVGEVASHHAVINQLLTIRNRINSRVDSKDLGNDVVLIYYRGPEAVEQSGQFHLLTGENDLKTALSGTELALAFDKAPGAQVFLLDVERSQVPGAAPVLGRRAVPQWPDTSPLASMTCAWLSRDKAPVDPALLLSALRRVVPQARNLYEIDADISRRLEDKVDLRGILIYEDRIPSDLKSLVLRMP